MHCDFVVQCIVALFTHCISKDAKETFFVIISYFSQSNALRWKLRCSQGLFQLIKTKLKTLLLIAPLWILKCIWMHFYVSLSTQCTQTKITTLSHEVLSLALNSMHLDENNDSLGAIMWDALLSLDNRSLSLIAVSFCAATRPLFLSLSCFLSRSGL